MLANVGDQLVSAQQAAHAKLRGMIFSGELRAGQPLRQEDIARRLGVSRLPVREALKGELRRSQNEHREMAILFRAGDATGVARACREHCNYTALMLVDQLRTAPACITGNKSTHAPEAA